MLSRHFYELEEVCYALLDSLRHKKHEEAVFWARELLLSHEDEMLTKTMVQAWIMYMGASRIDWLDAWVNVNIESDKGGCQRLTLVAEFTHRGSVPTLPLIKTFWIASRGFSPNPSEERVASAIGENDPISLYWWLGPTYEKKPAALVAYLANFVDSPEIFDSLHKVLTWKQPVQIRTLLSVCAVQLLCLESYPDTITLTQEQFVANCLEKWSTGLRSSRLYSITPEMLPRGYKRILQADALCHSALNVMKDGCKFWQTIADMIRDDETQEQVIDTYFPNDIPDEWSVEDRAKSHPVALDVYKVHMKPEYIIKLAWSAKKIPLFRKAWYPTVKLLFKTCGVPDR